MTTENTRYLNICARSKQITDRRAAVRGDKKLPEVFVPLGKGDDKRILILEISYTALGLMNARTEDKRKKYEDTLKGLREDGWEPELYLHWCWERLRKIPTYTRRSGYDKASHRNCGLGLVCVDVLLTPTGGDAPPPGLSAPLPRSERALPPKDGRMNRHRALLCAHHTIVTISHRSTPFFRKEQWER
eukprot:1192169-Prorocentrum_minimum.AAC.2